MTTKNNMQTTETAAAFYNRLSTEREPYITRAIEGAKYTIPSLFPKDSDNAGTAYSTPYQSIGARGLNNLASKLVLALLPPNSPFFRLSMSNNAKASLNGQQDVTSKIEQALGQIETSIMTSLETHQVRVTSTEAIKQLIVAGNALLFLPPKEGGMKLYKLNSYVLQRDSLGHVIRIITREKVAFAALPLEVQTIVTQDGTVKKPEDLIEIYTHTYLEGDNYVSYQEAVNKLIPGSEQTYPKLKTPWIPIRMVKVDGESYGRSFIEEYLGDLKSLEALSKAIVEISVIMANIVFLVNPNGVTNPKKVSDAQPGAFVVGRKDDIAALTLEKYADLQVAKATADGIESRLSYAFLLNSAVQRNGERVTAEEIRYVAGELEDTLGGVYSILSQEFQLPLVRRSLVQAQSLGEIPALPEGAVEPSITTGLEALGRGHDLNKLSTFMQFLGQIPEAAQRIKVDGLLTMIGTSLGLDVNSLVKSDEEIQQEMMQQQQMAMMQQATPNLAKGFADAQLQQQQAPTQGQL